MATVTRNIHFYRAVTPDIEAGNETVFNPRDALDHVDGLPFTAGGRYYESRGRVYCTWIDKSARPARLRYAVVRRSALPRVERHGAVRGLQLAADAGLVEQIHVAWFGRNIVGCDFNVYAPRLPSLGIYLQQRGGGRANGLRFEPLVRQDVAAMLNRYSGVRLLRLRVRRSDIPALSQIDQSLGAALSAQANAAGGADEFELVWRPRAYSRGESLGGDVFRRVKRLARRSEVAMITQQFAIEALPADEGPSVPINILDEHLVVEREIEQQRGRGRALIRNSAYRAIGTAYNEFKDDLLAAASIQAEQPSDDG